MIWIMPVVNHELLRARRDELDLSNRDLAARVKTSANYVSNIVNGANNPGMRVVHRFARALDLTVDEILAVNSEQSGVPSEHPLRPDSTSKMPPTQQGGESIEGEGSAAA